MPNEKQNMLKGNININNGSDGNKVNGVKKII